MPFAKGFIERILDIRGNMEQRDDMLLRITDVYMSNFNRVKALMWFKNIPSQSLLFWQGDVTFTLGEKKGRSFNPETMSDFISIMQSYGHELDINLENNPAQVNAEYVGQRPVDLRLML